MAREFPEGSCKMASVLIRKEISLIATIFSNSRRCFAHKHSVFESFYQTSFSIISLLEMMAVPLDSSTFQASCLIIQPLHCTVLNRLSR